MQRAKREKQKRQPYGTNEKYYAYFVHDMRYETI